MIQTIRTRTTHVRGFFGERPVWILGRIWTVPFDGSKWEAAWKGLAGESEKVWVKIQ